MQQGPTVRRRLVCARRRSLPATASRPVGIVRARNKQDTDAVTRDANFVSSEYVKWHFEAFFSHANMSAVNVIDEDEYVCYVCFEEGGRVRCDCRLHIHDACLHRLLTTVPSAQDGVCCICKSRYTGVLFEHNSRSLFDREYTMAVAITLTGTLLLIGSIAGTWARPSAAHINAQYRVFIMAPFLTIVMMNCATLCVIWRRQVERYGLQAAFLCQRRIQQTSVRV